MRARTLIVMLTLGACLVGTGCEPPDARIPVTTASDEAREYYLKGRKALEQFQPDKARERFMKALSRDPDFALAYMGMAQVTEDRFERQEWILAATAKARLASHGERSLIRSYNAVVRSDFKTAFLEARELVQRYPREARAHLMLADAYLAARSFGPAVQTYQEAIDLEPELAAAHRNLGRTFLGFGRHQEAQQALMKHLELLPELPASHELLAVALMKGAAFDDSIARYKEVQRLDPDNRTAWIGIGYNLLFRGGPEPALAHFRQIMDSATDDAIRRQALRHMAAVYLDGGDQQQALAQLERAYALAADAPEDAYHLKRSMGDIYLNYGQVDLAAEALDGALNDFARIGFRGPKALVGRAHHLYDQSRLSIARGQIEQGKADAMKFRRSIGNSRISGAKDMWGELQTRLALLAGDAELARDQIQRVSDADPRILFLAAQVQEAAGQMDAARMAYEEVAEFNQPKFELAFVRLKAQRRFAELSGARPG